MSKVKLYIFVGFWFLFFILYLSKNPIDSLTLKMVQADYITLEHHSEYKVMEILSLYYSSLVIFIGILSYNVLWKMNRVKVSICFLLLGLVLFLSESNMIAKFSQPILAAFLMVYLFYLLFTERAWCVLLFLSLGFFKISFGFFGDMIYDTVHHQLITHQSFLNVLPALASFFDHLNHYISEEVFECIGLGFVCLAALVYFSAELQTFSQQNPRAVVNYLFWIAVLALGNGLLHFEYFNLNYKHMMLSGVKVGAYILALCGFIGFVFTNKYVLPRKSGQILTLFSEDFLYCFVFVFFVLMPTIHGRINSVMSVMLWLPFFLISGFYLYTQYPRMRLDQGTLLSE